MKYTEATTVDYGDYDPEGNCVSGFITEVVASSNTFGEAVGNLVRAESGNGYARVEVLMTTRAHWSGYSEYTVTNTWSEIILTVPAWNWEKEWPSLGDFLRALAEANPEADR